MTKAIVTGLLVLASTAIAAGDRGMQAIQIKSDKLVTDSAARTATFTGKVVARQADITMYADKVVVTYSDKEKEVTTVEATGNVRISQGARQAEAGHAVYDNREGKIILDSNPQVFEGDNLVTGKIITYYVNDQKSVVSGGPDGRVEAVIHPKGKGNPGGAKP